MYRVRTILLAVCSAAAIFLLQGCDGGPAIGKKAMVDIVAEMYLADQYVERNPSLMVASDSMLLYAGIMAKYGFSIDDYNSSMEYYIQDGNSYPDILNAAYAKLEKRERALEEITRSEEEAEKGMKMEKWWAIDSLRSVEPSELLYDRLLRSVKWMVLPQERLQVWTILDSAVVDIPQNPQWWSNTACPPEREYASFMVKKEKTEDKDEKDSGKLRIPDKRKPNPERVRKIQ